MELAQDCVQWRALVLAVLKPSCIPTVPRDLVSLVINSQHHNI
jgi:hypothetical protein